MEKQNSNHLQLVFVPRRRLLSDTGNPDFFVKKQSLLYSKRTEVIYAFLAATFFLARRLRLFGAVTAPYFFTASLTLAVRNRPAAI